MQSSGRQPRKWTLEEDQKLREEVETQLAESGDVKDWCRVAAELPGRTNKDCRKRWHNSVAGGLKKGQWSKSEDLLLCQAVEQYGQRWTLVANCIESRSADQCAKRWQQSLDPDLDRSEWREDEDQILIEATQQLGRHWKDIQREHFPGRSKNCIKNRYTVLKRRYLNQGIELPSRGSSPSEANTPGHASPIFQDDEDYLTYDTDLSGHLMPPNKSSGRAGSHRSRPSWDAEEASWNDLHNYNPPMEGHNRTYSHSETPMPTFAYPPPQAFSPHLQAGPPAFWNWTTSSRMGDSPTMYTRSPTSYAQGTNLAHHYDDYSMTRPLITPTRSYSTPSGRPAYPSVQATTSSHIARSSSWPDQQQYDSTDMYGDPRLQQHPSYHF